MKKLSGSPVDIPADLRLTTLANVKELAHIPSAVTTHDTILQTHIDSVCRAVLKLTGRVFLAKSGTPYVYILNGDGSPDLWLPQWPITAINSIEYGYISDSADTWVLNRALVTSDYHYDSDNGIITLISNVWGRGQIKVSWDAGYSISEVPADLVNAIETWVSVRFKRGLDQRWDKTSEGLESQAATWTSSEIPRTQLEIINSYRRWDTGIG